MKTYNKIISVLLCIIMISISIPSFVFASDDNEYNNVSGHVNEEIIIGSPSDYSTDSLDPESLKIKGKGEKSLNELKEIDITKIKFPECISKDKALNRGHVNRLEEQESNLRQHRIISRKSESI